MDPVVYESMSKDQQLHWWFVARRKILRSVLATLRLKPNTSICEAGCGVGGNLAMLKEFGKVHAFEINPAAIEKCRLLSDADIREGALPDQIPFMPDHKFDLIVAFDVLEHIEADLASYAALVDKLEPGGHLFVTVPAHAWLMSAHDHAHHHFRRYSKVSLQALADLPDIKILRIGYFNTLLFPMIALVRLFARSKQDHHSDAEMPGAFANAVLTRIFSCEAWLTGRCFFPFGTSLALLVQKKR